VSRPPASRSSALAPADYPAPAVAAAVSGLLVVGVRLVAPDVSPVVPLGVGALAAVVVVRSFRLLPVALGVGLAALGAVAPEPFRAMGLFAAPTYLAVGLVTPIREEAGLATPVGAAAVAGLGLLGQVAVAVAGPASAIVASPLAVVVWTPVAVPFLVGVAASRRVALGVVALGVALPLAVLAGPALVAPSAPAAAAGNGNVAARSVAVPLVSALSFVAVGTVLGSPLLIAGRRWTAGTGRA
jgi:hypothetical protein